MGLEPRQSYRRKSKGRVLAGPVGFLCEAPVGGIFWKSQVSSSHHILVEGRHDPGHPASLGRMPTASFSTVNTAAKVLPSEWLLRSNSKPPPWCSEMQCHERSSSSKPDPSATQQNAAAPPSAASPSGALGTAGIVGTVGTDRKSVV